MTNAEQRSDSSYSATAPLLVVVAIFSLQFGAAIAQTQFALVGPSGAAFLRLALAALILLIVLRPRVWRWTRRTWSAAVLLGLALGGMNQLIYLAIDHLPLGVAITVEFLGPLTLAAVQMRRWLDGLWALMALAGVSLIGLRVVEGLSILGVVLALCAGACWAGYILASRGLGRAMPDTSGLAVSMLVAACVSVPLGLPGALAVRHAPEVLGLFVLVALMSSAIPYALELRALRRMPTRMFGVLQSLGPAAAAIAGLVVLGQPLDSLEVVALLLITCASIGITAVKTRSVRKRVN